MIKIKWYNSDYSFKENGKYLNSDIILWLLMNR